MTSDREWRQLCARIRDVLLHEWDPIGVADVPEAQGEYDSHVGPVFTLLQKRSTTAEIFEHLWTLETGHMRLAGDREKTQRVAASLAALGAQQ